MIERTGDVFTTDAEFIAHGCNTDGVMGAGVAAQMRSKFPEAYDQYVQRCEAGSFHTGDCQAVLAGTVILNLATQDRPGRHARYEWVEQALQSAADVADALRYGGKDAVIAMPQIGAGIGGLEWERVEEIVREVERAYPHVEFEVWKYGG